MRHPTLINRSRLPPEAFRCPTCDEIAGTCVHTDKTTNPRYEVRICGIVTGRREPMNELLVMGPVTPKPMTRPTGAIFSLLSDLGERR